MTTKDQIFAWLKKAQSEGATHLIVVCDTFDYDDYPVYFKGDAEAARKEVDSFNSRSMQLVMEVYNLSLPIEPQLKTARSFNY